MLSAFTDVLHVANLSTGAHLISILKQVRCHTLSHSHPMSLVYIAHTNPCFRVTPSPRRTSPSWPASSADARPASGLRSSWGSSIWSSRRTQGILVFLSCKYYFNHNSQKCIHQKLLSFFVRKVNCKDLFSYIRTLQSFLLSYI